MRQMIDIFKALGNETRLSIYLLLLKDELCVCELENILKMEQSIISHSLRTLKEAGLINSRREGKWIIYFSSPEKKSNQFVIALENEITLSEEDQETLAKCKNINIRQKCKIN